MPLVRDIKEEGDITDSEISWGVRGLIHISDTPTLGSNTRKTSPHSRLNHQWDLQEGCRKQDSTHKECAHTVAYSWEQDRGIRLKILWWFSLDFPSMCPNLHELPSSEKFPDRTKATLPRRVCSCGGKNWKRTSTASEWGKGSHYLCSQRLQIGSCVKLWLACQDCLITCSGLHWAPLWPPCSSTAPLWGNASVAVGRERTRLEGMEPA